VCGEEALRPDGVYQASAVTLQPTSVTLVSHQTLHQLVLVHPDLVVTLLARLEERLERASERLVEVASQRVPSRVAAALLRQMAGCACPVLQLTHQDIADMVGTQREVVTRLLDHLRSRGAIRLGRGRVEVLNAELLAALRKEPF
jgi:CRP/FNR family transcriptional regulator